MKKWLLMYSVNYFPSTLSKDEYCIKKCKRSTQDYKKNGNAPFHENRLSHKVKYILNANKHTQTRFTFRTESGRFFRTRLIEIEDMIIFWYGFQIYIFKKSHTDFI